MTDVTFNAGTSTTEHGLNDIILEGGGASSSITGVIEAGSSVIVPISSNMGPIGYTGSMGTSGAGLISNLVNGSYTVTLNDSGILTIPGSINTSANVGNVVITSSDGSNNYTWTFASNGVLIIPDNGDIQNTAGYSVLGGGSSNILTHESLSSGTALDTSKQLHILAGTTGSPQTYTLADGVIGQQVFFIPAQGYADNGVGSVVITLNATINNGGNYQFGGSKSWNPFAPSTNVYVNANAPAVPSPSAIFDGTGWVISGGSLS